jgi:hypothetical protein
VEGLGLSLGSPVLLRCTRLNAEGDCRCQCVEPGDIAFAPHNLLVVYSPRFFPDEWVFLRPDSGGERLIR